MLSMFLVVTENVPDDIRESDLFKAFDFVKDPNLKMVRQVG